MSKRGAAFAASKQQAHEKWHWTWQKGAYCDVPKRQAEEQGKAPRTTKSRKQRGQALMHQAARTRRVARRMWREGKGRGRWEALSSTSFVYVTR